MPTSVTLIKNPLTSAPPFADVVYPESDGKPIADNTLQFEWISTLKGGLDALFADNPAVFVAGDLLWYPVEGDNQTRMAPDVFVAFGRPKGYRGSYLQWRENGVAPQVVFEILSPGNRAGEMRTKRAWYEQFGVQEYYEYDPNRRKFGGWLRPGTSADFAPLPDGFVSPLLGIRFDLPVGEQMRVFRPDGNPFLSFVETVQQKETAERDRDDERIERRIAEAERRQAEAERRQAEAERRQAEAERRQAEAERDKEKQRAEKLAARLRALGIEPSDETEGV